MPIFTITPPVAATDPARIDAFLAAKGFTVIDGSSVHSDGSVSVTCDRDPSATFKTYSDAATLGETATQTAIAAVKTYLAVTSTIPLVTRTPEQTMLLALIHLFGAQIGATP